MLIFTIFKVIMMTTMAAIMTTIMVGLVTMRYGQLRARGHCHKCHPDDAVSRAAQPPPLKALSH